MPWNYREVKINIHTDKSVDMGELYLTEPAYTGPLVLVGRYELN